MDPFAPFDPVVSCEAIWDDAELKRRRRGVWLFRREVMQALGGRDLGVARACDGEPSMHTESRAWDWGPAKGEDLTAWQIVALELVNKLTGPDEDGNEAALARRFGLRNIIFDGEIWNSGQKRWEPYHGKNDHTTHVHFDFSRDGAEGRTSGYAMLEEVGRSPVFPFVLAAVLVTAASWAAWRLAT